jgi:hypothetical protein
MSRPRPAFRRARSYVDFDVRHHAVWFCYCSPFKGFNMSNRVGRRSRLRVGGRAVRDTRREIRRAGEESVTFTGRGADCLQQVRDLPPPGEATVFVDDLRRCEEARHADWESRPSRAMPPWKAASDFPKGDRLSESEIGTIKQWVDARMPGDPCCRRCRSLRLATRCAGSRRVDERTVWCRRGPTYRNFVVPLNLTEDSARRGFSSSARSVRPQPVLPGRRGRRVRRMPAIQTRLPGEMGDFRARGQLVRMLSGETSRAAPRPARR